MEQVNNRKIFPQKIADKLIKLIEENNAPWQKPWTGLFPYNPTSNRRYRGINAVQLMTEDRADPRWMTLNQANALGYKIKKGEKASLVEFWKMTDRVDKHDDQGNPVIGPDGKPEKITIELERPFCRYYHVFNGEQIDGLPPFEQQQITWDPNERAERLLRDTAAKISHDQMDRAFYDPLSDSIHLPRRNQFPDQGNYYAVAAHELGHWTGHKSRLNRDLSGWKGSGDYAREELRTEMASMFLCGELGLHPPKNYTNNIAYLQSWIKDLKDHPLEICNAARDAEKAFSYIIGMERDKKHQKLLETESPQSNIDRAFQQAASLDYTGDFTVRACIEDDRGNVTNQGIPDDKAQFFGVYAVTKDGLEQHIQDCTTRSEATDMAKSLSQRHQEHTQGVSETDAPKTYIKVPYKARNEAKAMGAKYDPGRESWYIPAGVRQEALLEKWTAHEPTPHVKSERQLLAVPYEEKDLAKAAGAVWNRTKRAWEVGPKGDVEKLKRWLPGKQNVIQEPSLSPREEFSEALRNAGAAVTEPHPIENSEKMERIPAVDDQAGQTSIAYRFHTDGHPAGYVKNFRSGLEFNWKSQGYVVTREQTEELKRDSAQRIEKRRREWDAMHGKTAEKLAAMVANLHPPTAPTPYMESKGIGIHEGIYAAGKTTCIPLYDATGKIWSMQRIYPDGRKHYEERSRKDGCFHVVGGPESLAGAKVLVICEGYATAATLSEAIHEPIVAAMDSGNLKSVALALRAAYPDKAIVFAADNDEYLLDVPTVGKNVGKAKAEEAAQEVGGFVVLPVFPKEEGGQRTFKDWNDMAKTSRLGIDGVVMQLSPVINQAIDKTNAKERGQEQTREQQREKIVERNPREVQVSR